MDLCSCSFFHCGQSSSLLTSLGRSLLLLLVFIGVVGVSVVDSIELGRASVALRTVRKMSCCRTGCLSCQGKQSTSSLGRSFSILSSDLLLQFVVDLSMGDLIKLFRLGTGGEEGLWAVVVMAYHGGLGGMGGKTAMVDGVRRLE